MIAHTPGPWRVRVTRDGGYYLENDRDGRTPAEAFAASLTERPANARLIAAAPDLLSALEDMVETFARHNVPVDAYLRRNHSAMVAAIARARGEP